LSRDVTDQSESPPEVYDRTTITLHWATAILVAIQFLIGRTTNFLPRGPLRVDIWSAHVLFGFALAGRWSWGCFGAPRAAADCRRSAPASST
jgi:cytochrome b561